MNKQNRSTEGCSKLKRSVDMTSPGKNISFTVLITCWWQIITSWLVSLSFRLMTHSFWIVPWNGSCLLVKLLAWWARGPKFAPGSFHYDFRDLVLSTSKFFYDIWRQSEIKLNSYSTEFNGNDAAGIFALILITPKIKLRSSLKYCWWGGGGGGDLDLCLIQSQTASYLISI